MIDLLVFLALAALIIGLPAGYVLLRLARKTQASAQEEAEIHWRENKAAARARLRSLKLQQERGLISLPDATEYEDEINTILLAEAEARQEAGQGLGRRGFDFAGIGIVLVVVLVLAPVAYYFTGTPEQLLSPERQTALVLERIVRGLEQRLEQNPQDTEALDLLGRALMAEGRPGLAAEHFSRALAIEGDEPGLLARNLEALIMAGGDVQPVLERSLRVAPNDPLILWLAGLWARKQGDIDTADEYWQRARKEQRENDEP